MPWIHRRVAVFLDQPNCYKNLEAAKTDCLYRLNIPLFKDATLKLPGPTFLRLGAWVISDDSQSLNR